MFFFVLFENLVENVLIAFHAVVQLGQVSIFALSYLFLLFAPAINLAYYFLWLPRVLLREEKLFETGWLINFSLFFNAVTQILLIDGLILTLHYFLLLTVSLFGQIVRIFFILISIIFRGVAIIFLRFVLMRISVFFLYFYLYFIVISLGKFCRIQIICLDRFRLKEIMLHGRQITNLTIWLVWLIKPYGSTLSFSILTLVSISIITIRLFLFYIFSQLASHHILHILNYATQGCIQMVHMTHQHLKTRIIIECGFVGVEVNVSIHLSALNIKIIKKINYYGTTKIVKLSFTGSYDILTLFSYIYSSF